MKLREFFYVGKSDRAVLFVLLILAACAVLIIFGIGGGHKNTGLTAADSLRNFRMSRGRQVVENYRKNRHPDDYDGAIARPERFPFDPNTADSTQLLRLGLRPWQVRAVYRYRAKGGVFRRPSDFARLYGLTAGQYRELEPYIRISADYQPAAEVYGRREAPATVNRDTIRYPVKLKATERVMLNTADTAELKRVPGIGSYYAREIVYYRKRLGGFCDASQLMEIEGFPASALHYFTVQPGETQKLNINKLTLNQLKRHPYMGYFRAKEIVDYRRLKGPIHSLRELSLLRDFTSDAIVRLEPYVTY